MPPPAERNNTGTKQMLQKRSCERKDFLHPWHDGMMAGVRSLWGHEVRNTICEFWVWGVSATGQKRKDSCAGWRSAILPLVPAKIWRGSTPIRRCPNPPWATAKPGISFAGGLVAFGDTRSDQGVVGGQRWLAYKDSLSSSSAEGRRGESHSHSRY